MVTVRPFKALRPPVSMVEKISELPYDVINTKEAKAIAKGNEHSFFHITRAEIDLPETVDIHDEQVYQQGKNSLNKFIENGWLVPDKEATIYLYKQKMGDHEQTGFVGCVSADEYNKDLIKKHELTRKDKEDDRTKTVVTQSANAEPVFLTYRAVKELDEVMDSYKKNNEPVYDFVADDGIGHTLWVIEDQAVVKKIQELFKPIDYLYVADGHHRSASAARAKAEKIKFDDNPTPEKEYNYFLAVIFPHDQLKILDYNRVLFEMNGMTKEQFFGKLEEKFEFIGNDRGTPKNQNEFGLYIDGKWYQIRAKAGTFDPKDPIGSLDVAILQSNVLDPLFGIKDPRTDNRIDFVGGIRGIKELEKRVDSGECKLAFAMYPTTLDQLIDVADTGNIMPPKSTWFEPKLRSGLFIHLLD
ncbi:MAG: DUF1015 domain-containing protein [bacterium]